MKRPLILLVTGIGLVGLLVGCAAPAAPPKEVIKEVPVPGPEREVIKEVPAIYEVVYPLSRSAIKLYMPRAAPANSARVGGRSRSGRNALLTASF